MTNRNDIEQLFREHYEQMHRLAMVLLHDDDLACDIVHDVFASLLEGTSGTIMSRGYLLRAVRNRCLNHIRNYGTRQRIAAALFMNEDEYDSTQWPDEETIARINALIASELSEQAQRVIHLRFFCGLPFSEVASGMGISETAVYRHLRHALILIRKKLNEDGQI